MKNRVLHPRKRHSILKKYGFRCCNCGRLNNEVPLEIDHIIPITKGGTNDESNLQVLCFECNQKKYNYSDDELKVFTESWGDKIRRQRLDKWQNIKTLKLEGKSHTEIAALLGMSTETVRRHLRMMEALDRDSTDSHHIVS